MARRWGGRTNHLHGQLIEVVSDYRAAIRRLAAIDVDWRKRPIAYTPTE